jgi:starvation-inducible DNA-binding protein
MMARSEAKTRRTAPLATPTGLASNAIPDLAGALTTLLADMFALYVKTKNFHWHVSGPHFRDYHLLLDEQAGQILATTDAIAERVRKIGGTTLRSIGQIGRLQRVLDNDADYVTPLDMLAELRTDNMELACWKSGSTRPSSASGSCSRRAAAASPGTEAPGTGDTLAPMPPNPPIP